MKAAVAFVLCAFLSITHAHAEDETADHYGPESKRPPRTRIANALAKHLSKHPLAKRLLTPETCKVMRASEQAVVLRCHKRSCEHPCQSVEASAELRFRPKGVTSIRDVRETRHGETGACGHCMSTE